MHKQNADEEQAMQDLYGKQATKWNGTLKTNWYLKIQMLHDILLD